MKTSLLLSVALSSLSGSLISGCGSAPGASCTVTPFIEPATATLDHSAQGSSNSVQFATGYKYTGTSCVHPAIAVQYSWSVSDTASASITSPGGVATCLAAAASPITVASLNKTVDSTGAIVYIPTGLPNATLVCQ